jgi:hypothetical protein
MRGVAPMRLRTTLAVQLAGPSGMQPHVRHFGAKLP